MTNEEQNIAIAEACGWKCVGKYGHRQEICWTKPNDGFDGHFSVDGMHKYTTDLNAMHAAEQILDGQICDVRSLYLDTLAVCCNWPKTNNAAEMRFEVSYLIARSTAAQRAEAFLKTLGKWKESK